jgi:S-adenosylhomocysteine hydrolase
MLTVSTYIQARIQVEEDTYNSVPCVQIAHAPKSLDEKVANWHLPHIAAELSELSAEQVGTVTSCSSLKLYTSRARQYYEMF